MSDNKVYLVLSYLILFQHPGYIPLLRALCVCDNYSIPQNQLLIGHKLLEGQQVNLTKASSTSCVCTGNHIVNLDAMSFKNYITLWKTAVI